MEETIAASTLAWIYEENIVNEMGDPIRVGPKSNYFFLKDIYDDDSDEIAIRKPSQDGVSTYAILSEIHDAKYQRINQIHTLPTQGDVRKFVPSKVDEIIMRNPCIRSGMSTMDLGAIGQKQFGSGFVYYKPTFSEREGFIITSDRNWYDEVDRSNQKIIRNYESRLEGQGSLKQQRWFSTPTIPGFGIDKVWSESDQKHWRFKCQECGREQHMVWPDNVDMTKGRYICSGCAKPLNMEAVRYGGWKAKYPKKEISGYWLSQMIAPWVSAADMCKAYEEADREHTLEYFYNHKLGMPFISGDSAISAGLIFRNLLGNKPHVEVNSCAGVDVQLNELYMTLGSKEGVYALAILKTVPGKTKWERLSEMIKVYDIRYMVIDGGFTPNEVLAFARKHRGIVWVNWYKDDPKHAKIVRWSDDEFNATEKKTFEEEVTVLTERDRMIDFLLSDLQKGNIRFFYTQNDEAIKTLVKHVETTYARTVTDRLGMVSREWVSTGKDDFLHSTIYWRIARMKQEQNER
jgi:hypothetical protein